MAAVASRYADAGKFPNFFVATCSFFSADGV
jgi:hypothetical protein